MSDIEHELLGQIGRADERSHRLAELAQRALLAARDAQDAAGGGHEPWIDDALADVARELTDA